MAVSLCSIINHSSTFAADFKVKVATKKHAGDRDTSIDVTDSSESNKPRPNFVFPGNAGVKATQTRASRWSRQLSVAFVPSHLTTGFLYRKIPKTSIMTESDAKRAQYIERKRYAL